jgi:hypothetical protein
MGACCDIFEKPHEIETNESRLKLLETKVNARTRTPNDHHFTYYLHYFDQHAYLEKALKEHREHELTEDSVSYQLNSLEIEKELAELKKYLSDLEDKVSALSRRMQKDLRTIGEDNRQLSQPVGERFECMVKAEIQQFTLIQGISRLKLIKTMRVGETERKAEEVIVVSAMKQEPIYR